VKNTCVYSSPRLHSSPFVLYARFLPLGGSPRSPSKRFGFDGGGTAVLVEDEDEDEEYEDEWRVVGGIDGIASHATNSTCSSPGGVSLHPADASQAANASPQYASPHNRHPNRSSFSASGSWTPAGVLGGTEEVRVWAHGSVCNCVC
jgi:hypothetical protein